MIAKYDKLLGRIREGDIGSGPVYTDVLGQQWSLSMNADGSLQSSESLDAVKKRIRNEVNLVSRWLSDNAAKGIMSEVGWPQDADTTSWNQVEALMEREYTAAGVPCLLFTAQGAPGPSTGQVTLYTRSSGTYNTTSFDTAAGTAIAPEQFEPIYPNYRGIDIFGGTANDGGGSGNASIMNNSSPGTYGTDWWYEGQGSYDYLASRGYTVARVGFRLERLYPTFYSALDSNELARLVQQVTYAVNAGMKVVLDCHNYGMYVTSSGPQMLTSTGFPLAAFTDFWTKMSTEFKANSGVLAYSLMNEPHDLPNTSLGQSGAKSWELASQAAVDAIRANSDTHEIHVSVYEWGHWPWVSKNHAKGWITDSNFRYEGHHYLYFNRLTAANYPDTYADENTFVAGTWINQMNPGARWSDLAAIKYNDLP